MIGASFALLHWVAFEIVWRALLPPDADVPGEALTCAHDSRAIAMLRAAEHFTAEGRAPISMPMFMRDLFRVFSGNVPQIQRATAALARVVAARREMRRYQLASASMAVSYSRKIDEHDAANAVLQLAYFGNGVTGLDRASRSYFGEDAHRLSVRQLAMLIGVAHSPSRFDPARHPTRILGSAEYVLKRAREAGVVSAQEQYAALACHDDVRPACRT